MDYSKMSDAEIGRRVAAALKLDGGSDYNGSTLIVKNGVWATFDPCNNPADAWPIIYRHKISIEFDGDDSTEPETTWCHARDMYRRCGINYQSNPLRAAMIVFLLMQESANVQGNPA
ncbi:TPA: DUF2591 family protein [Kluyvera ascorbata]|nr:DUF2591 family protein [Kluyvera ascorbata]